MKLNEIKPVWEQKLETKTAEELWTANTDAVGQYTAAMMYLVKPSDTTPVTYQVFSVVGDQRKQFGTFSAVELSKTLAPIRPNQTPDAEGFTTYIDPTQIEAFKYSGEPLMVELDGKTTVQLNDGDYLTRSVDGSSFKYDAEEAATFNATLRKA